MCSMSHFDPELAFKKRAARANRKAYLHEARAKWAGARLAKYAVRQANRGHVNEEMYAQTTILPFIGSYAFIGKNPDEVRAIANNILANESQGLEIAMTRPAPQGGYCM